MDSSAFLLILGILLTMFGGSVVFSEKFFSAMHQTLWKPTDIDTKALSKEGILRHNRYRGFLALIAGLFLLWMWFFL